eukprot:CAMPEP_0117457530 /NCGR_PEP_ID=MMETSP0784-20121206/455_1 /TAXON_ID=39447 /ORGANISM="" /LENGTH=544 /DNA_ID=CAMNT_0005251005 /DNA_START=54 /DNA_END=1686 /DNA_ORIENTATION=-
MDVGDHGDETSLLPADSASVDEALPQGPVVPRIERNHLLFPPRGVNRPTLRQVLSEPTLRQEFFGPTTEPPAVDQTRTVRRRPGHRNETSRVRWSQPLPGQTWPDANVVGPGGEYRKGLCDLFETLDAQSAQKRQDEQRAAEYEREQHRLRMEQEKAVQFANRGVERPPWAYCDPMEYFQKPLIERDEPHPNEKLDVPQSIANGGWAAHNLNERGRELDEFGTRDSGKPQELARLDFQVKKLEIDRLRLINDAKGKKNQRGSTAALASIDEELQELRVQQREWEVSWGKATIPPGLVGDQQARACAKALAAEMQPPGPPRPAKPSPTEMTFAVRLDRKVVAAEVAAAKEEAIWSLGTLRKQAIQENADDFSCLKRSKKPVKEKRPNHIYFSVPEPYKPGENALPGGLKQFIEAPERTTSFERDFVTSSGERKSFWCAPKAGRRQWDGVQAGIRTGIVVSQGMQRGTAACENEVLVDLTQNPMRLKEGKSQHLKKGTRGGAPCRQSAVISALVPSGRKAPTNSRGAAPLQATMIECCAASARHAV